MDTRHKEARLRVSSVSRIVSAVYAKTLPSLGKVVDRRSQQLHFGLIRACRQIAIQLRGELRQRSATPPAVFFFGGGECVARGLDLLRGEAVRALELIEVRLRKREARRPYKFL